MASIGQTTFGEDAFGTDEEGFSGIVVTENIGAVDAPMLSSFAVFKIIEPLYVNSAAFTFQKGHLHVVDVVKANDVILTTLTLIVSESITTGTPYSVTINRLVSVLESIVATSQQNNTLTVSAAIIEALSIVDTVLFSSSIVAVDGIIAQDQVTILASLATEVVEQILTQTDGSLRLSLGLITSAAVDMSDIADTHQLFNLLVNEPVIVIGGVSTDGAIDSSYTFAMNSLTRGVSEYTNYKFNSMSMLYGATDTGIYKLVGSDDSGTSIDAVVKTGLIDFGSSLQKQVPYAYIGLNKNGGMLLKTITDYGGNRKERWYSVTTRVVDGTDNIRVKLGRGVKSRYWQFELTNIDGADFELDTIELLKLDLKRRI